jgi:ankyrin repeat protein
LLNGVNPPLYCLLPLLRYDFCVKMKRPYDSFDNERSRRAVKEVPIAIRENNLSALLRLINNLSADSILGASSYSLSETLPLPTTTLPTTHLGLLHVAAFWDSLECFLFLLSQGYSASRATPNDYHPLHYAAVAGSIEVASFLVHEARVSVTHRPPGGVSPLFLAAVSRSTELIKVVLSAPNSGSFSDYSAVVARSLQECDGESLEVLLSYGTADAANADALSPLMQAVALGFIEAVRLLLDRGCDPNYCATDGNCALRVACLTGEVATVGLLLKRGADPNIIGSGMQSGVHWAAMSGSAEIVKEILAAGGQAGALCGAGLPAWAYAIGAKRDRKLIVTTLLKAGAPVNTRALPAVRALAIDDPELLTVLLNNGLDLQAKLNGRSLRELALEIAAPKVKAVIEKWTPHSSDP